MLTELNFAEQFLAKSSYDIRGKVLKGSTRTFSSDSKHIFFEEARYTSCDISQQI